MLFARRPKSSYCVMTLSPLYNDPSRLVNAVMVFQPVTSPFPGEGRSGRLSMTTVMADCSSCMTVAVRSRGYLIASSKYPPYTRKYVPGLRTIPLVSKAVVSAQTFSLPSTYHRNEALRESGLDVSSYSRMSSGSLPSGMPVPSPRVYWKPRHLKRMV